MRTKIQVGKRSRCRLSVSRFWAISCAFLVFGECLFAGEKAVFANSLEMSFLPVSGSVLLSRYETRIRDFDAFVSDGVKGVPEPSFLQNGDHPVVNVSWEDAQRFCIWLTATERKSGVISGDQRYRLPTEEEWLQAAGVESFAGQDFVESRELIFCWGESWPPPAAVGNFGAELGVDEFDATSPVGSFRANENGFFDLSGNVWEWCADTFEGATDIRVLKGGSWRMREPSRLALNRRIGNACGLRLPTYGFRVALETVGRD